MPLIRHNLPLKHFFDLNRHMPGIGVAVSSGAKSGPLRTISTDKLYNDISGRYHISVADVATASWYKSSWSSYNGSCVEVAKLHGNMVCMRDTKANGIGPILAFTYPEWQSFLSSLRAGELDFNF
jgi:Domain of unknown function (DUF397)